MYDKQLFETKEEQIARFQKAASKRSNGSSDLHHKMESVIHQLDKHKESPDATPAILAMTDLIAEAYEYLVVTQVMFRTEYIEQGYIDRTKRVMEQTKEFLKTQLEGRE